MLSSVLSRPLAILWWPLRVRASVRFRAGFDIKDVEPARCVATCATVPALLLHGYDDSFIPLAHARQIAKGSGSVQG